MKRGSGMLAAMRLVGLGVVGFAALFTVLSVVGLWSASDAPFWTALGAAALGVIWLGTELWSFYDQAKTRLEGGRPSDFQPPQPETYLDRHEP